MLPLSPLKQRIITISKKYGLSHVGSSLSAIDILDKIYPKGEVVVSCAHAGIAYYVVKEKYDKVDAEAQFKEFGVHCQMYGSLGHGLGVAVGKALSDRTKPIYCLTSDGEWMEGSMWEALRIAEELELKNLHIYVNANGWGGLQEIDSIQLYGRLKAFSDSGMVEFHITNTEPLEGLEAHYEKII